MDRLRQSLQGHKPHPGMIELPEMIECLTRLKQEHDKPGRDFTDPEQLAAFYASKGIDVMALLGATVIYQEGNPVDDDNTAAVAAAMAIRFFEMGLELGRAGK